MTLQVRIGTLMGDARGLGCHWYYELDHLKADFEGWVSGYNTSKTDRKDKFAGIAKFRYEGGLKADLELHPPFP